MYKLRLTAALTFAAAASCVPTGVTNACLPARDVGRDERSGEMARFPTELSSTQADLDQQAAIRRSLAADEITSKTAKNVTIQTRLGHVTLSGFVASPDERARVEALVRAERTTRSVVNRMRVQAKAPDIHSEPGS